MMYIHYCQNCYRIHMLNGHKTLCPGCQQKLTELSLSYMDYISLSPNDRKALLEKLRDAADKPTPASCILHL